MKRTRTSAIVAAGILAVSLAGCSTSVAPDEVGLYYMKGSVDGYKFGHCMKSGAADDYTYDNEAIFLPANLRTWKIDDTPDADEQPTIVSAKAPAGQSSGTQVKISSQTSLLLDTTCDGENGGPLKDFWEKIGRRYKANTPGGWKNMMQVTVSSALNSAIRDVAQEFEADALVNNTRRAEVQTGIAAAFQVKLKALTGADFFCGPDFVPGSEKCTPVQMIITNIEYADAGIQAARNAKQKAVEEAAAAVAAAQGQVDAAKKMEQLYQNKAWVELQLAQKSLEEAQACANSSKCIMVRGGDEAIINAGS